MFAFTVLRAATGYSVCRQCCCVFRVRRGTAGLYCSRACYETFRPRRSDLEKSGPGCVHTGGHSRGRAARK